MFQKNHLEDGNHHGHGSNEENRKPRKQKAKKTESQENRKPRKQKSKKTEMKKPGQVFKKRRSKDHFLMP